MGERARFSGEAFFEAYAMLRDIRNKLDSTLLPAVLFALLVIYLLTSDPNIIGPF
ncbi:hypothetical protein Metme_3104 [Methylomonas methanica MC09]|uniref:Uncharacterized protein n=1 Tax=Methylomonas methanica (strain DSM 25384 / MC09) TaxID=857087 RepID=G0A3L0_METMM|nr:hypothetical protein Metme_3104 [Methylomonas methanica MC09]